MFCRQFQAETGSWRTVTRLTNRNSRENQSATASNESALRNCRYGRQWLCDTAWAGFATSVCPTHKNLSALGFRLQHFNRSVTVQNWQSDRQCCVVLFETIASLARSVIIINNIGHKVKCYHCTWMTGPLSTAHKAWTSPHLTIDLLGRCLETLGRSLLFFP